MFISALILFFLVLISYSFIESFDSPIIEGAKGKMKGIKKKKAKKAIKNDVDGNDDDEDNNNNDEEGGTDTSATATASQTTDVVTRLNDHDSRITSLETQVQTIQTGLAGSQQTTVDVGEEDNSEEST